MENELQGLCSLISQLIMSMESIKELYQTLKVLGAMFAKMNARKLSKSLQKCLKKSLKTVLKFEFLYMKTNSESYFENQNELESTISTVKLLEKFHNSIWKTLK